MARKVYVEGRSPSRTRLLLGLAREANMDESVVEFAPADGERHRGYKVPESLARKLRKETAPAPEPDEGESE